MALEMRDECERCHAVLARDGEAYICVFERTFCPACADAMRHICPNCGGGQVRRPRAQSRQASGQVAA